MGNMNEGDFGNDQNLHYYVLTACGDGVNHGGVFDVQTARVWSSDCNEWVSASERVANE